MAKKQSSVVRGSKVNNLVPTCRMPLRSGKYVATFSIAADAAPCAPNTLICTCDVYGGKRELITAQQLFARDLTGRQCTRMSLPFAVPQLEFGMQFRVISSGAASVSARPVELTVIWAN
jgi:hypothetical protein